MSNLNIEMIQNVAKALGELKDEVVFVGGATVSCYLDLDIADEVRPTEDIDVIIEITSMAKYHNLTEKLLSMKFMPDTTVGAPICRWKFLGMTIDIMPLDENILGFSNRFYKKGFENKISFELPDGQEVYILPLNLFLATKLEAYFTRGGNDPRYSRDLEDIVAILADAKEADNIAGDEEIVEYLKKSLIQIIEDKNCVEAIKGFIQSSVNEQFEVIKTRVYSI